MCNISYASFERVGIVYWPCVQLELVLGLLKCYCAAQLLVNVSLKVEFVQYKNITSDHLLGANTFLSCPERKINPTQSKQRLQFQHLWSSFILLILFNFGPQISSLAPMTRWSSASSNVSWYIGVFTRLSRWEPGFESHHHHGTFVLQQGNLSTLLLSTQGYKWGSGRMWQIVVFEFASAIITGCYTRQGMLPGEWKLCTVSAALKYIQWPG